MKKLATSLALAAAIACSAFAGSAAAASELETHIEKLIGVDYKYGGTTTRGFDCSGFTSYVFAQLGVELPRRSVDQANEGTKIAKSELRAGDLVFFNTDGKGISHVGIYLGDGKMAHASSSRGVSIGDIHDSYYSKRYVTARRIFSDLSYAKLATDAATQATGTANAAPAGAADVSLATETAELAAEHADGLDAVDGL
ncbi:MAG TPA: C40 family peptidase [Paenibacillus sp.]|nr:C40 family peptidase [Paenibacillus sp.]